METYFTGKTRQWMRGVLAVFTAAALILPPFGEAWAAGVTKDANGTLYLQDYTSGGTGGNAGGNSGSVGSLNGPAKSVTARPAGVTAPGAVNADGSFNLDFAPTELGQNLDGTQANNQIAGGDAGAGPAGGTGAAASAAGYGANCIFGAALTQLISTFITHLITSMITETVESLIEGVFKVPTHDNKVRQNTDASRSKDVCSLMIFGICILPSLNAVFYCLANGIIQYIGQATVRWINSGFQGNPAFINDPGQYFKDAADKTAGNFINGLSNGLLCEPYRAQIQLQLLSDYQKSTPQGWAAANQSSSCAFTQASKNPQAFLSGNFSAGGGWPAWQTGWINDNSDPIAQLQSARQQLSAQISAQDGLLKLQAQWSNGFLSVKDPVTGRITTPGHVLENQINQRLFNGEKRLLLSSQFDQVLAALINQLVKIALSEVLKIGK